MIPNLILQCRHLILLSQILLQLPQNMPMVALSIRSQTRLILHRRIQELLPRSSDILHLFCDLVPIRRVRIPSCEGLQKLESASDLAEIP